uniref:LAGLIDADG endonuclease n=1 Tax=Morchella brunnea TaxID=1174671 RepID=A0A8K1MEU4_9PEZI|nr:LAGLIDADG endonuclease [Morchella brunnea]UBU98509.1 LAGLIDADG endonuclease [Morchella brunnea]
MGSRMVRDAFVLVYKNLRAGAPPLSSREGERPPPLSLRERGRYSIGFQVELTFSLTQHSRDTQLMKSLVEHLDCGRYIERPDRFAGVFTVNKLKDIEEKIVPLFNQYPLQCVKSLDYADFKRVAEIIKDKGHLTASGLDQIRKIKSGMNSGRNHG